MGLNFEDMLRANDEMSEAIQRVRDYADKCDAVKGWFWGTVCKHFAKRIREALDGEQ